MPTLVIRGKSYPSSNVIDLSLNDLRNLKAETGVTVGEFRNLAKGLHGLTLDQVMEDDGALLAMSIIVWASRRRAGERLTLEEACEFSLTDDFEVIPDPDDDAAEGDAQDPPSARRPKSSPAGPRSGKRAPRPATTDRLPGKRTASTRSKTSKSPSAAG